MSSLNKKVTEDKIVQTCSVVFKMMEHKVYRNKQKDIIWNFSTFYGRKDKTYAVYCAGNLEYTKNLIQVAQFQAGRQGMRLVVVALAFTEKDLNEARKMNFCLVTMDTLIRYGNQMLEIKQRNGDVNGIPSLESAA